MKLAMKNRLVTATVILLMLEAAVWAWGRRGVLPTQCAMVRMSPDELEKLVLRVTPIGTDKADVETALRNAFLRDWRVIDYEAVGLMSHRHFHVPVSGGDYYFLSNFAVFGPFLPNVVTINFLFDRTGKLKDVLANVWSETL